MVIDPLNSSYRLMPRSALIRNTLFSLASIIFIFFLLLLFTIHYPASQSNDVILVFGGS